MSTVEKDKVQPAPREGREEPVRITADTARQGPDGHRVLYVLLGGFVGAALACFILFAFWSS
ncbi:hypothetical protein LMIY3S_01477 [Labrys miyagiensis]